jgi:hypothetical protein
MNHGLQTSDTDYQKKRAWGVTDCNEPSICRAVHRSLSLMIGGNQPDECVRDTFTAPRDRAETYEWQFSVWFAHWRPRGASRRLETEAAH